MSDDRHWAEFCKRFADVAGRRGHISMTARLTQTEKAAVEWIFAEIFCEALAAMEALTIKSLDAGPDPPDFFVNCEGEALSVELVELIDLKTFRNAQDLSAKDPAKAWLDQQWSEERYVAAIRKLVNQKGDRYRSQRQSFDVLLIYTDEPWLAPNDLDLWNRNIGELPIAQFKGVYVMGSYVPGAARYPLHRIAGSSVKELVAARRAGKL
ncbi:MAG: hypothetical protein Q8O26_01605 [Phreatobacter sp.]|uniref:hypothetical protein n=1 Tax=Phreatobacter sp. TaxID=1966341 RepID=UPI002734BD62|nr:hypothetical protein [Phreatobacter sp.]MDP2800556.1 hypothetical protein [Phreatobacter sp.]